MFRSNVIAFPDARRRRADPLQLFSSCGDRNVSDASRLPSVPARQLFLKIKRDTPTFHRVPSSCQSHQFTRIKQIFQRTGFICVSFRPFGRSLRRLAFRASVTFEHLFSRPETFSRSLIPGIPVRFGHTTRQFFRF